MIIGYKAVNPSCNSKTPYLRSRFLIWRTANILQQSRLLGRLNKNAVESVVDGIPCTSFQNPGSDFAFGNCHPKAHSNCHECSHFPVSPNIQRGRNFTFDNFEMNCSFTNTNNSGSFGAINPFLPTYLGYKSFIKAKSLLLHHINRCSIFYHYILMTW